MIQILIEYSDEVDKINAWEIINTLKDAYPALPFNWSVVYVPPGEPYTQKRKGGET